MVTSEASTDDVVVAVDGDLDHVTAGALGDRLRPLLAAGGPNVVVVSLANVQFMDSTGLGVLVGARRTLLADGRSLALRDVPPRVMRLLEVTRLIDVFGVVTPRDSG